MGWRERERVCVLRRTKSLFSNSTAAACCCSRPPLLLFLRPPLFLVSI